MLPKWHAAKKVLLACAVLPTHTSFSLHYRCCCCCTTVTTTTTRLPLHQLEARLALRSNRPAAEAVEDEVQAAMAAEAAHLTTLTHQLHAHMDAAGQQVQQLRHVSAALLQHIADKEAGLSLEEKVAMMDGRVVAGVPPSPTVLSVSV